MDASGISGADLERVLDVLDRADAEPEVNATLPWALLHLLKDLVPCDVLSVSGQDTPHWEFFAMQELPVVPLAPAEQARFDDAFRTHYWGSTCSYPDRTGDVLSVRRTSDHLSDREHRAEPMYQEFDRPLGIEHELMLCIDTGAPQRTLRLLFSRGPGLDFSWRDVALLTLLRPHLQAVYDASQRRHNGVPPLTGRQKQVLQYVAAGYANRQIARQLEVSEGTVRKHLENVYIRLEVSSRTAAVARLNAVG